jgi:hypothetical protein
MKSGRPRDVLGTMGMSGSVVVKPGSLLYEATWGKMMTEQNASAASPQEEPRWTYERDETGRGGWWIIARENGWQSHRFWTPHAFSAVQWLVATLNDCGRLRTENETLCAKAALADWIMQARDSGEYNNALALLNDFEARYDALTPPETEKERQDHE